MLKILAVAAALLGLFAASADASIVFERGDEIWTSADDGTGARRLAAGREPHMAPGGATVVYRSLRSGRRVYAVPTAGGPRRELFTAASVHMFGTWFSDPDLFVDFAAGGQHALYSPLLPRRVTRLVDLAAGAVRSLPAVPAHSGRISPDGREVVLIERRRPCDLDVLDLATGRLRPLARRRCVISVEWGRRGIGILQAVGHGRRLRFQLNVIDPATGAVRRLLTTRRQATLAEPGPSGSWRLEVFGSGHLAPAAWLVTPDGHRLARPLSRRAFSPTRFTADDRGAVVQEEDDRLIRIDFATGARHQVGIAVGEWFDVG